jgi:phage terminase small subunit
MSITARQREFIRQYLSDPKRIAKEAALRAGYSVSCASTVASRMLASEEIVNEINRQLSRHLQKLDLSAQSVIDGVLRTIEDARSAGQGAWQCSAILRGYELLGRYLGMFSERIDVSDDDKIIARLITGRKRVARLINREEAKDAAGNEELPAEPREETHKPN